MRDLLPVDELALMDVDAASLDVLAAMTRRMLDRGGHPSQLAPTTSRTHPDAEIWIDEEALP